MAAKNLDKRQRVMRRSIRLGHCVCDPKLSCPCDLLKQQDVCLCAGERLDVPSGTVRLTQLVEKAGCASKIDQAALKGVLAGLPFGSDPRVLVGACAGDDAGVFRIDANRALVQTVDVFSPSVDDPYTFGQIAAANSLSDIYAMGGEPLTALSIVGFPIRELADSILHDILRGGMDKMAEAGVAVIGGHSIKDSEIKAGFAVTGIMDLSGVITNAGARLGDVLVLTKPIGTGVLSFAGQIDRAPAEGLGAAAHSMTTLNKTASELMVKLGAHACTDITGFGLLGHLGELALRSGVDVDVVFDDIPLFEGVVELVADGVVPGAVERNRESSLERVDMAAGVTGEMVDICCDPQTSGGLLIAVEQAKAADLVQQLHAAGVTAAAVIGRVVGEGGGRVQLLTTGRRQLRAAPAVPSVGSSESSGTMKESAVGENAHNDCCSHGHGASAPAGQSGAAVSSVQQKFQEFLKAANAPGALDAATKQAIAIALSVLAKCEPCTKAHIAKARQMGFTQEEIDEAAWMAIAFGGSPTMMFYNAWR